MSIEEDRPPGLPSSSSGPVEVLYEVQPHAKGGPPSSFPDSRSQQVGGGLKLGSWSGALSNGIRLLKEKWSGSKRMRALNEASSLFVSLNGEYVAVASGNQITILREEDKYMSPCGIFASNCMIYLYGAWLEPQGILGVVDDMDTLYILKSNGEEISRTTSKQMKLSFPVVGIIALRDLTTERSLLSSFCIITTDGSFHYIETNKKASSFVTSSFNLHHRLKLTGKLSLRVACLDYYPVDSLVAMVCSAAGQSENSVNDSGFYSFCLCRLSNLVFELLFSSHAFEGLFFPPSGDLGPFVKVKMLISPHGKFLAALDLNGFLDIYEIQSQAFTVALISLNTNYVKGEGKRKRLKNVLDFSWWSEHVIVLSMLNDVLTMINVQDGQILRKEQEIHSPVLSRTVSREGHVFALENMSYSQSSHALLDGETAKMVELTDPLHESCTNALLSWSLFSLSERSVNEIYELLIEKKHYQEALNFARRYCLDNDEVYKSQWLCSNQGVTDITTILKNVKNNEFVLLECVDKVGKTEDAALALLLHGLSRTDCYRFSSSEDDKSSSTWKYRIFRLQLLQCKDRLETFLGINMGRFSVKEYNKFRTLPISESAMSLAASGKIGALNLLFKHHGYSLASDTLQILGAIPETIPVHTYSQLLPGRSPPTCVTLRDEDWVESEKTLSYINNNFPKYSIDVRTENLLKLSSTMIWPSTYELSEWYKSRSLEMDNLSGQLDNCLSLVEFAFRKGMVELSDFLEDITYLHQLTYSNYGETNYMVSISSWEQLPDYEKFKMMLKGLEGKMLLQKLLEKAIPFMHVRDCSINPDLVSKRDNQLSTGSPSLESFLVKWLKEIAAENKLDLCLAVIKEGCEGIHVNGIFKDEAEATETALACIYSCTLLDCWNTMASIVSHLPQRTQTENSSTVNDLRSGHTLQRLGSPALYSKSGNFDASSTLGCTKGDGNGENICRIERLNEKVKAAEGHIEVGRLLAYYQVPKPLNFFLMSDCDKKNAKQLIRLILSKFSRQQGRADSDWANLWNDMQCFQAMAFSFLDMEYLLTEFCRGLLKAGKFSLARNYLKGSGNTVLAPEKAETLVIQAAREYFFSAPNLSASEIWKARECLCLFPDSGNTKAEMDIIDALTKRLPNLGVTLLPMQFKQIGNPMDIINMVIRNQTRTYLDVDELIDIAKLLGLKSQDDIATIQEAVAREAAVAGDLQLAFDLCIDLAKKDHGPIWDLASAIARGPILENMDTTSRKQLLGFALSYCDNESIGELLHAWKDVNMQSHDEKLIALTGNEHLDIFSQSSIQQLDMQFIHDVDHLDNSVEGRLYQYKDNDLDHIKSINNMLCSLVKDWTNKSRTECDCILKESGNASFVSRKLPWLFKLCMHEEYCKQEASSNFDEKYGSVRVQAGLCILSWLTANNLIPSDSLISSFATHIMELPTSSGEEVTGCSILLNLTDSFHGVKWIEEQLRGMEGRQEAYTMMNVGMMYSSLQSLSLECSSPSQRRKLLSHTFQERDWSFTTDDLLKIDGVETKFWREWSSKLEEQKMLAEQARELERIIPGVDTTRFLSGDHQFIEDVILSFVESAKSEKRHILKEAVKLADTYGLKRTKVLVHYLYCTLVSLIWTDDEILNEVSDFKDDVVFSAAEIMSMIGSDVYPEIEGLNKQRISYIYNILSACSSYLRRTQDSSFTPLLEPTCEHKLELFQFYKILEQECRKISSIDDLNFKNIANLHDLNFEHFNEEVYKHVCEANAYALADMVQVLVSIYGNPQEKGLISRVDVYKHHILNMLEDLNAEYKARFHPITSGNFLDFINSIQNCYENSKAYIRDLSQEEMLYMLQKLCILCISEVPLNLNNGYLGKDCLLELLKFWVKIAEDFPITVAGHCFEGITFTSASSKYLMSFRDLILKDSVTAMQGWNTLSRYSKFSNCLGMDISLFCKSMVLSGCNFKVVVHIFLEGRSTDSLNPPGTEDIVQMYTDSIDFCLNEVLSSSDNQYSLHKLLVSVSKFVDDMSEVLNVLRYKIWEKLVAFSDNTQLSSHFRVYALELMQLILGRKVPSISDDTFYGVLAWEGWDDPAARYENPNNPDAPSRLTSNLVALKSNQLVASISSDLKIFSEDIGTIDSATSCYMFLLEAAVSERDIETLQSILLEWERLFTEQVDRQKFPESIEEHNDWNSDEWGEGWKEDNSAKEIKHELSFVHPLHACWMATIKKLIKLSKSRVLTRVMDRSLMKSRLILLSRNEAEELLQLLAGIDPNLCLKAMLLLPYEDLWFQSLIALENKLKQGDRQNNDGEESELLMLILSSGLLPSVANDASYSKTFSYLCYLTGHLSRRSQEDMLKFSQRSNKCAPTAVLFCRLLLPCFVSELVSSGQYLLAGYIVSQWMHTHASFRLVNVVEVGLRIYLESLLDSQIHDESKEESIPCESLAHTCTNLTRKMPNLLRSSLSALKSIS